MPPTWEIGEVDKIHLARGPFTRQRRIVGAVCDGCGNCRALPNVSPTGDMSIGIIGTHRRADGSCHPIDGDIGENLIGAESRFELLFAFLSAAAVTDNPC